MYGLLGLLNRSQPGGGPLSNFLEVNYHKKPAQLFWELVFGLRPKPETNTFKALAQSLISGCILDGEGLEEIASASACMRAMSVIRVIIQLFGWNNLDNFMIVDSEKDENEGFWLDRESAWVRSWIAQLPADHRAADDDKTAECHEQLVYAILVAMACHRPGPACCEAADRLPPDWHCSSNQRNNTPMNSAETVKSIELYSHKFGPDRWGSLRRKLSTFYDPGCTSQSGFPTGSWLPPLVVDIKPIGWSLAFEPSPDLLEYLRKAEFEPGSRSKLMVGRLELRFGSRHGDEVIKDWDSAADFGASR